MRREQKTRIKLKQLWELRLSLTNQFNDLNIYITYKTARVEYFIVHTVIFTQVFFVQMSVHGRIVHRRRDGKIGRGAQPTP